MTGYTPTGPWAAHADSLERKTWCAECGRFLAKHVYKADPDDPTFHVFDRCELAPGWRLTGRPSSYSPGQPGHYAPSRRSAPPIVFTTHADVVLHCACGAQRKLYTGHR